MSVSEVGSAQREALAAEVLRARGRLCLRVRGESMLPTLRPGDIVEIERCSAADVSAGEIVLALRDERFFLHRAVGTAGRLRTRGDSMPGLDPAFPAETLLGRAAAASRGGESIKLAMRPWTRVLGLLLCHSDAARNLFLRMSDRACVPVLPDADMEAV